MDVMNPNSDPHVSISAISPAHITEFFLCINLLISISAIGSREIIELALVSSEVVILESYSYVMTHSACPSLFLGLINTAIFSYFKMLPEVSFNNTSEQNESLPTI